MGTQPPTTGMVKAGDVAPAALAKASAPPKPPLQMGERGVELRSLDDAWRFAQYVVESGLAPKGMDKAAAILVALQFGAEAGLGPMASLRSVVVINNRPGWSGDAALALVRQSGLLLEYEERVEGEGEARRGYVRSVRRGGQEMVTVFSVKDAKVAQLWGKQGPWSQYPDRMLKYRARGFNLRDQFGDLLLNLPIAEELLDFPDGPDAAHRARVISPASEAPPPPPPAPDPLMAQALGQVGPEEPAAQPEPPAREQGADDDDPTPTAAASVASTAAPLPPPDPKPEPAPEPDPTTLEGNPFLRGQHRAAAKRGLPDKPKPVQTRIEE